MIHVGFLTVRLYGLMIGLGILVGAWVAARIARRFSIDPEDVSSALLWIIIPGVIGARLYHVVDYWDYYVQHWGLIPQVWTGGLGIYGALGGGMIGMWLFCKKHTQKFLQWTDVMAFGLPIGQAIGRWGNYFNQELYGKPFDSVQGVPPFWAMYIDPEHRLPGYEQYSYFHPVFLYESLWSVLTFLVLLVFFLRTRIKLNPGTYFTLYIIFYSIGRIILEYIRLDEWTGLPPIKLGGVGVTFNQVISGVLLVFAVMFLLQLTRRSYKRV